MNPYERSEADYMRWNSNVVILRISHLTLRDISSLMKCLLMFREF